LITEPEVEVDADTLNVAVAHDGAAIAWISRQRAEAFRLPGTPVNGSIVAIPHTRVGVAGAKEVAKLMGYHHDGK
jgi:hypothetical protein